MGKWDGWYDDEESEWDYYRPSQPRKVEGGIKTKSERGAIGETWWSKRWVGILESFGMGTRLTRGRNYARLGQVLSIDVEPGIVRAKVQGSMPRPYTVTIRLQPLADRDWEKVIEAMAAQAIFAAKLLAGEMPRNIEEAFSAVHVSLFPTRGTELSTKCSCPDWANPCKHTAAVYYLLAERFDEDPFLIFKLRGRSREQIIQSLREKRTVALPAEAASASEIGAASEESLALEDYLAVFWQAGDELTTFTVNTTAPAIDKAILKRLGQAPFSVGTQNLTAWLARAYDVVDEAVARKMAEGE